MLAGVWVLAQQVSPTGSPIGDTIVGFGVAAPVIGLLVWLLVRERARSDGLLAQVVELTTTSITSQTQTAAALDRSATATTATADEVRRLAEEVRRMGERRT